MNNLDLNSLSDMINELDMKGVDSRLPLDLFMRPTNNSDDFCGSLITAINNVEDPMRQIQIIKYLFSKGLADESCTDNVGRNALAVACMLGYKNTVHLLLHDYHYDAFGIDDHGSTCLMLACENGYDNIARLLLDHVKFLHGHRGVIKFLNEQNKNGETSFSLSLKHEQVNCANVLSDYLKCGLELAEREQTETDNSDLEKSEKSTSKSSVHKLQTSMSMTVMHLQLPSPSPQSMSRRSSASSSLISTDRTSVPDLSQLKDYCAQPTLSGSYSYLNLHNPKNTGQTNISVQVGVQFSSSATDYHHDDDAFYNRHHANHVKNMLNENQNVRRHYKVQRLFRVDSGGSPSTDDACSSPEIGRSPTLANRFKRLLDRRTQYATGQKFVGRYSYDPVTRKSDSSSETEIEVVQTVQELSGKNFSNKPVVRSKSNSYCNKCDEYSATNGKFKLPPLKCCDKLNVRPKL